MDQILFNLNKVKSSWELLYNYPNQYENWCLILNNLVPLFRKNTLHELICKEDYYPQVTTDCRYYIKPNNGSCGKGIFIIRNLMENEKILKNLKDEYTISPEIIPNLILKNNEMYKYDYRVWIGIKSNLSYFICPTLIKRVSMIPFSLDRTDGSLTNTALYSDHINFKNENLFLKINFVVKKVLSKLNSLDDNFLMLTGWDFIEDKNGKIFILEVNCSPSISILHKKCMIEFLNWIEIQ